MNFKISETTNKGKRSLIHISHLSKLLDIDFDPFKYFNNCDFYPATFLMQVSFNAFISINFQMFYLNSNLIYLCGATVISEIGTNEKNNWRKSHIVFGTNEKK